MTGTRRVIVRDSITSLDPGVAGAVLLTGSHGGRFTGIEALLAGVAGLIAHDAAVGLDSAGVESLGLLERYGVPCAAIGHGTARIGDGRDCATRGVITYVNAIAGRLGVTVGSHAADAAEVMAAARLTARSIDASLVNGPPVPIDVADAVRAIWLLDSASLVRHEQHAGAVAVTGSHGSLLGGRPESAIRARVFAAVFNDAGCVPSRLPVLDASGIAAVTVAAATARIGDARSSLDDGRLSEVNDAARRLGAIAGDSARRFIENMARSAG